jgi:serine/threonine protein kinase
MPTFVSPEVRDLISRMLQPNPVKRIKLREIQQHLWYVRNVPAYIKELSKIATLKPENEVDHDIVNQLFEKHA